MKARHEVKHNLNWAAAHPLVPKHPGTDAGKIPIIRSRAKLRLSMLIKPSFEGKPLTDPSPGTISLICSPFPALVASFPPPFKSHCYSIAYLAQCYRISTKC